MSAPRCTYRECVTLVTGALDWLSAADKELLTGRALGDWLGWDNPVKVTPYPWFKRLHMRQCVAHHFLGQGRQGVVAQRFGHDPHTVGLGVFAHPGR